MFKQDLETQTSCQTQSRFDQSIGYQLLGLPLFNWLNQPRFILNQFRFNFDQLNACFQKKNKLQVHQVEPNWLNRFLSTSTNYIVKCIKDPSQFEAWNSWKLLFNFINPLKKILIRKNQIQENKIHLDIWMILCTSIKM